MGFFTKVDPLDKLRLELEAKPTDTKLLLDVAAMLKARGATGEAVDHLMRAANGLSEAGFALKAVAIAKQVSQLAPKSLEAYEFLAQRYEQLKLREELRGALKQLVPIYRSNGKEALARATETQIEALGPGR